MWTVLSLNARHGFRNRISEFPTTTSDYSFRAQNSCMRSDARRTGRAGSWPPTPTVIWLLIESSVSTNEFRGDCRKGTRGFGSSTALWPPSTGRADARNASNSSANFRLCVLSWGCNAFLRSRACERYVSHAHLLARRTASNGMSRARLD